MTIIIIERFIIIPDDWEGVNKDECQPIQDTFDRVRREKKNLFYEPWKQFQWNETIYDQIYWLLWISSSIKFNKLFVEINLNPKAFESMKISFGVYDMKRFTFSHEFYGDVFRMYNGQTYKFVLKDIFL